MSALSEALSARMGVVSSGSVATGKRHNISVRLTEQERGRLSFLAAKLKMSQSGLAELLLSVAIKDASAELKIPSE